MASIVVKPDTVQDIQTIVELCKSHHRPLRINGVYGCHLNGVLLDMSAFSSLISIDHVAHQVRVGAFISSLDLQFQLHKYGLDIGQYQPALSQIGASLLNGAWIAARTPINAPYMRPLHYEMVTGAAQRLEHHTSLGQDIPTDLIWRSFGQLGIPTQITLPVRPSPEASILVHMPALSLSTSYDIMTEALSVMPFQHLYLERRNTEYHLHFIHQGSEHSCDMRYEALQDILTDHAVTVTQTRTTRDDVQSHLEALWGSAEYAQPRSSTPASYLMALELEAVPHTFEKLSTSAHAIYDAVGQALTIIKGSVSAVGASTVPLYPPKTGHRRGTPMYDLLQPQFDPAGILNPL